MNQRRDSLPEGLDYQIPYGTASLVREGSEMTVLTYMSMVNHTRDALDSTGIEADLVDLRFLDRASLDWDTVGESIRKTNNVLIVEQGAVGTSYGGWLADEIQRRFFDYLDQPVQRVTGSEASPSISKSLRASRNRANCRSRSGSASCDCCERGTLMASVVRMPEVLAGATEAVLSTWSVAEGTEVAVGDVLAEIETEKATVEYQAEEAGTLARFLIQPGDSADVGTPDRYFHGPWRR